MEIIGNLRDLQPWLIVFGVLFLVALVVLLKKYVKNLVLQRTKELESKITNLTRVINTNTDFIFTKDLDLNFTMCNKSFTDYFGKTEENFIGKNEFTGLFFPKEAADDFNRIDRIVINEKKPVSREEFVIKSDSTGEFFETVKYPLEDNGKVIGIMGVSHNITKRKNMETAAIAENHAKSMFLSSMSHEIRLPLNAIVEMLNIGKNAKHLKQKDECLDKIEEASRHLLGIINNIRDMSKIEANTLEISEVVFNFEKMFKRVWNIVIIHANEKNQSLKINIDENIPQYLQGDEQRLAQVLMNLIGNSIKFTHKNGIINLDVKLLKEEKDICELQFSITDNGIGINPQDIDKLFDSFHETDSDTAIKYGGAGLGLIISKNIIELMGGNIVVESEFGKGSKFSFSIKLKRSEKHDDININENSESSQSIADLFVEKR